MCVAVSLVTLAPRNWSNIIVCGLVLSVAFVFAREVPLYWLTASSLHVHTLTALAVFALLMGPTGLWYRDLKPQ